MVKQLAAPSLQRVDAKVIARPSLTPSQQGGAKAAHGPPPQSGVRWLPLTAPPRDGNGELERRVEALEEQAGAHAEDIGDVRTQLIDMQEQILRLQFGESEGAGQLSSGRAAVVDAKSKRLWSDDLGASDMVEYPIDVATSTDDLGLREAAVRLDKALSGSLRPPQSSQDGAPHIRELKLAAMEVLQALGYRHAAGAAAGDIGLQDEGHNLTDLDAILQQEDTAVEDELPGAYVECHPDDRADDELVGVLNMAQRCHEEESEWPIRMPKEWHERDPKRAARVMLRKVLARDVTTDDLQFTTESKLYEHKSSRCQRTLHRATVTFKLWGHQFEGPLAGTVSEAEREAFRQALDHYHEWICWQ